jgi:CIC family chloride channel protein
MMRRDVPVLDRSTTIEAFRRRFPLGSATRVILTGEGGTYVGLVATASAYGWELDPAMEVGALAVLPDVGLLPNMHIGEAMELFDRSEADDLAVLDRAGRVLGLITEKFVRRRYAEELEKAQRELYGED